MSGEICFANASGFSASQATKLLGHNSHVSTSRPRILAHMRKRSIFSRRKTSPVATAPLPSVEAPQVRFETIFSDPCQAVVLTPANEAVSLIEYVREKNENGEAVLFGWLRHFGCSLCKKQTSDWQAIQPDLLQNGRIAIALIGNGPTEHAKDFAEEMGWSADIFTDPDRKTYQALQFRRGLLVTFNPSSLGKIVASFRGGNPQTWSRIPTDAFQQGGAILVDKKGIVRFFHADAYAGDHVEKRQLLEEASRITE